MSKHCRAFYISNKENKIQLIARIVSGIILEDLEGLSHAFFSELALNKFIEEETRHGQYHIITQTKNSLKNSSQGERKKALLNHIITQNPEYIIVDNVFDSLDTQAQKDITNTLTQLSHQIPIVQIVNRQRDILPFITSIYKFLEEKLISINSISELKEKESKNFVEALPQDYILKKEVFTPLVKFNNVCVSYNERPIVNDICWEVNPGEFWQLIGPNGSGKSTLLTLISGDNPKAYLQDITLFGMKKGSGESVWDIKKHIGFYSSEVTRSFRRSDTIENMIISGFLDSIGLYKTPSDRQIIIAYQWLKLLNMFDIKDKSFQFLSEGHKRLVLIARAMVKQPPLLILDEPTNGLDDLDAKIFTELVNKIALESSAAILYVSHRAEKNIKTDYIYELQPNKNGSTGVAYKN